MVWGRKEETEGAGYGDRTLTSAAVVPMVCICSVSEGRHTLRRTLCVTPKTQPGAPTEDMAMAMAMGTPASLRNDVGLKNN